MLYKHKIDNFVEELLNEAVQEYMKNDMEISLTDSKQNNREKITGKKKININKTNGNLKDVNTDEEITHTFSKEHTEKMEELIKNMRKRENIKLYNNIIKSVAILLICAISINIWLSPNSKAIKEKIAGMLLENKTTHSIIDNDGKENVKTWYYDGEIIDITPFTYFPLNFSIDFFEEQKYAKRINLVKDDKRIEIKIKSGQLEKFDTEEIDKEYIKINSMPVIYYKKGDRHVFIYNYNDYTVEMIGNANYEDFVKIIQKMK